jgi:hypothetical protein
LILTDFAGQARLMTFHCEWPRSCCNLFTTFRNRRVHDQES